MFTVRLYCKLAATAFYSLLISADPLPVHFEYSLLLSQRVTRWENQRLVGLALPFIDDYDTDGCIVEGVCPIISGARCTGKGGPALMTLKPAVARNHVVSY